MDSWIKLFRKFREWGWYNDCHTKDVFLELILTANFEDKEWNGILIKRGQTIVGRKQLSNILGFSEQSVRTALSHLKSTSEITSKSYNKFSVITINNYDKYQEVTNNLTNNQPATNQQLTTPKEYKNKRIKEIRTYTDKNLTLDQVSAIIIQAFNLHLGTNFKNSDSFRNNLEYWLNTYEPKEIEQAIKNVKYDSFWKDKMTPVVLFRRKNPQGEPVDYISQLLLVKQKND